MIKQKKNKGNSLFKKIMHPLTIILLLQAVVLLLVIGLTEINILKENQRTVFCERVETRRSQLQYDILSHWIKMDTAVEQINERFQSTKQQNKDFWSQEEQANFLLSSYDTLVNMLRQNNVNGAFLILNDSQQSPVYKYEATRWGLGIRDYDSESSYVSREDIVSVRAPAAIQGQLCSMDSLWKNKYTFLSESSSAMFFKPLQEAFKNPDAKSDQLVYFSDKYQIDTNDASPMVACSLPLIFEGQPYGVLGIEISINYLAKQLPHAELGDTRNVSYIFAKTVEGSHSFDIIADKGSYFTYAFGSTTQLVSQTKTDNDMLVFNQDYSSTKTIGFASIFGVYQDASPFANESLVLIGVVAEKSLYSLANTLILIVVLVLLATTAVSLFVAYFVSRFISDPIKRLVKDVGKIDSENQVALAHLGIDEIDELVFSIEDMHSRFNENLAKTEFFARMSHDMRTPMNAIIGFSDQDTVQNATDNQRIDFLNKINLSGKYLLSLINDVLDMSKIDSGKLTLFYESVNMKEFFDTAFPIVEEIADKKGVSFLYEGLEFAQNTFLILDKHRMQQIFINLLSNAVKFTEKGGHVCFFVKEISRTEEDFKVEYIVEDNGCGMSKEFQSKLFMPFHQEHSCEGTGLGLSIVKKLVNLMGGTITFKSEQGVGSTFYVTFTHKIAKESSLPDATKKINVSYAEFVGKHVLLCEDNDINTQLATYLLTQKGMIVQHAADGDAAVKMFSASKIDYYDIVLMDIRMPIKNGLQATTEIRQMNRADAQTIPIIAMTANTFAEDIQETKQVGMNDHLSKPIVPASLFETMAKYIKK